MESDWTWDTGWESSWDPAWDETSWTSPTEWEQTPWPPSLSSMTVALPSSTGAASSTSARPESSTSQIHGGKESSSGLIRTR